MGKVLAAATSPTRNASSVSSSAVHPTATVCIQVPTSEMVWPIQKSRKFRYVASVRNGFSVRGGSAVAMRVSKGGACHSWVTVSRCEPRA